MSTKYIVNNLSGQTINGNPIDPKYKVYTALLTQSGVENIRYYNEGSITIGVTYMISANNPGEFGEGDFTNVGAPNNLVGTHFIATGTTPNSWGTFSELEYNTGAPVVTVLENTIGNIWFTMDPNIPTEGSGLIKSNGLFTSNKTTTSFFLSGNGSVLISGNAYQNDDQSIFYQATSFTEVAASIYNQGIEIRVYN